MSILSRPDLRFDSYDQLLADARNLKTAGWEKSGQWPLATICDHLARWINCMLGHDTGGGLPRIPGPFQGIARFFIRQMVRKRKYPTIQFPAPAALRPAANISEPDALADLTAAVARVQKLTGPTVQTYPFGAIPADDFKSMTLLHASHHLAFLRPLPGGGTAVAKYSPAP